MQPRRFALFILGLLLITFASLGGAPRASAEPPLPHSADAVLGQNGNVELVGQVGGQSNAVAVQGNYAYQGVGPRLLVLDITDPTSPVLAGQSAVFSNIVRDVAVVGDYAYVLGDDLQLSILNVSDPTAMQVVGTLFIIADGNPSGAIRIAVDGNYAYVADGAESLHVIDVSTPSAPQEVGSHSDWGRPQDVAVRDNYVYYVADALSTPDGYYGGGLYILDVTDPTDPQQVGYLQSVSADAVAVAGDYAYVLATFGDPYNVLSVVDISDPSNPEVVGSYTDEEVPETSEVAIVGDHAYLTARDGLRILDVADPEAPTLESFLELSAPTDVVVAGEHAYVSDWAGLWVVQAENAEEPSVVGSYLRSHVGMTAVADNKAYLATGAGLQIFDVSDPANPAHLGTFERWGHIVAVAGNYVYLGMSDWVTTTEGSPWVSRVYIIDVSNPAAPQEAGVYEVPVRRRIEDLVVNGNYLYLSLERSMEVIDVSDPTAPTKVNTYTERTFNLTVSGGYLYAGGFSSIYVYDVSNPDAPGLMGEIESPVFAREIAISGNTMYVVGDQGLYIVDVTDPIFSEELSYYSENLQDAANIVVHGTYAYITKSSFASTSDPYGDLVVVDVSDPRAPETVGFYDTPGESGPVTAYGNEVYVSDGEGGLFILRFTPPMPTAVTLGNLGAAANGPAAPFAMLSASLVALAALGHRRLVRRRTAR